MIVITDQNVNLSRERVASEYPQFGQNIEYLNYEKFIDLIFSDEGYDVDDQMMIDINAVHDKEGFGPSEALFEALDEESNIGWFSLNGSLPGWAPGNADVDDFRVLIEDEDTQSQYYGQEETHEQVVQQEYDEPHIQEEQPVSQEVPSNMSRVTGEVEQLFNMGDPDATPEEMNDESEDAKIVVFGSSKGGTGKTFTSIISTYRYAKTHPDKRVALVDFDLIDAQLGISIHEIRKTLRAYYNDYNAGMSDFKTMNRYVTKSDKFPRNLDFYLAPSNGQVIDDDEFWFNVIDNLNENYDIVVFDTGIDYLNVRPIAAAYMSADKINLVTTTSIKSVTSVTKQIQKLKGETANPTYTVEDNLGPKLNVIITAMSPGQAMNNTVVNQFNKIANVLATFGVITDSVTQAEYFGKWNIFDNNDEINETLDKIMSL